MAINPGNGVLDITNGIIRVSSIDVRDATGFNTAINTVARNTILLYDDQESTTNFIPQSTNDYQSTTGVTRDTTNKYIELNSASDDGWIYWPLKLPNAWKAEFDMNITASGGLFTFTFFNTSTPNHSNDLSNDGGYKIIFDNTNNNIIFRLQGVSKSTTSVNLRSNDWQHVNINYYYGQTSVSIDGKIVASYRFTEDQHETNHKYVGFSAKTGTIHKIRKININNADKWTFTDDSNASDICYLNGNVGIGTTTTDHLLDVHGNAYISENLTIQGNLNVLGTTTMVQLEDLQVENAVIELGNNNVSDTIDLGIVMNRPTANVVIGFRGDESELAIGYTHSDPSGSHIVPIADGALKTTIYGNLHSNNVTTGGLTVDDEFSMGSHILPTANDTYDIGSAEYKIRDLYVADNSLWVGDEAKITFSSGELKFRKRKTDTVPAAVTAAGGHATGAKAFAGVSNLTDIKAYHWLKYMRTLSGQSNAKMSDVFRDHDADYETTSTSSAWSDVGDHMHTMQSVAIGKTTTPTAPLDVVGAGVFSGDITTSGNIGVNKPSPTADVHVVGYQYINDAPTIANSFDHTTAPLTLTNSTVTSTSAVNDPSPVLHLTREGTSSQSYGARATMDLCRWENNGTNSRSRLDFQLAEGTYANTHVMSLRSDGRVGIGVTNPSYTLDVDGHINLSTGSTLKINGTDAVFSRWTATANGADIYRSSGNVGINNTSPTEKLDVVGNIKASGNILLSTTSLMELGSYMNHAGDTDTYMGFPLADTISMGTGGSERMRIASSGHVGINNNSPAEKLDVVGNIKASGSLFLSTTSLMELGSYILHTGDTDTYMGFNGADTITMTTGGSERMRIDSSGNVGIGETSPQQKLHVDGRIRANTMEIGDYIYHVGDADTKFGFSDADRFAVYTGNSQQLLIDSGGVQGQAFVKAGDTNTKVGFPAADTITMTTGGSERMRIDSSGNVGIGVAPSHKLDVAGDINFTGSLLENGVAFQGSNWTVSNSNIYYEANVAIGTNSVTSGARLEVAEGPLQLSKGGDRVDVTCGEADSQQTYGSYDYTGANNSRFGHDAAVSADGKTMVVGARDIVSSDGGVFVYEGSGTDWTLKGRLKISGATSTWNGYTVAVSEDGSVIVCTGKEPSGSSTPKTFVYVRSGSNWTGDVANPTATLTGSHYTGTEAWTADCDISKDGNTIVVGAGWDDYTYSDSGSCAVYVKPSGGWVTTSTATRVLAITGGSAGDVLGWTARISGDGNTIVAGAFTDDSGGFTNNGLAYVYVKGSAWSSASHIPVAVLTPSDPATNYKFGWSVDISDDGDTIVCGAPEHHHGGTKRGAAYVFLIDATHGWVNMTESCKITASDTANNDYFGHGCAISGDASRIFISLESSGGTNTGSCYVYNRPGAWNASSTLSNHSFKLQAWGDMGGGSYWSAGRSTDTTGTVFVVGSQTRNSNKGSVTAWRLTGPALDVSDMVVTGNLTLSSTGSVKVPVGTTAQRPSTAYDVGMLRFNSTLDALEVYKTSGWFAFATPVPLVYEGSNYFTGSTITISSAQAERVLEISKGATIRFQLYGAAGGVGAWSGNTDPGGPGGYVDVQITFTVNTTLYAYVGQGNITSSAVGGCGGGSTDIRTTKASDSSGSVTNSTFVSQFYSGMSSALAVAGGGGGAHGGSYGGWGHSSGNSPGSGGPNTSHTNSRGSNDNGYTATGASITSAGQDGGASVSSPTYTTHGVFGGGGTTGAIRTHWAPLNNGSYSGYGWPNGGSGSSYANGGGGGGYYGGATNWPNGGGGSNYTIGSNSNYNVTTNSNTVLSTHGSGQLIITIL